MHDGQWMCGAAAGSVYSRTSSCVACLRERKSTADGAVLCVGTSVVCFGEQSDEEGTRPWMCWQKKREIRNGTPKPGREKRGRGMSSIIASLSHRKFELSGRPSLPA